MTTRCFTALAVLLFTARGVQGQGCSDAGVCTAGPIGEPLIAADSMAAAPRHFARLTIGVAGGEQGTRIVQVQPELSFGITEKLNVQLKVPYLWSSGNLGANSGVGDPVLTGTYAFIKRDLVRLDGLLGVKVNSGDAGATADGRPLPMPYQVSLGTTDLLAGISYRRKVLGLALAYQHVLVQRNANGFVHSAWLGSADSTAARGYFESYGLRRASDAVARVQYTLRLKDLAVQPGLLAIVHLADDTRGLGPGSVDREAIVGSAGTTLNLTVDALYPLSDAWILEAAFGSPLMVRAARPDGLTRSTVINVGIRFAF